MVADVREPSVDVDCEGCELAVLRAPESTPRFLTVEAHPHLGCSRAAVERRLRDRGYDIVTSEPINPDSDIVNVVAGQDSDG